MKNNTKYGENACQKLFQLDLIYNYFSFLHEKADSQTIGREFIENDKILEKYCPEKIKINNY
jgi:uncharacterized protein YktB (UPF0637 family)